jgi:transcriptional regulator with XRE-family HTH domain
MGMNTINATAVSPVASTAPAFLSAVSVRERIGPLGLEVGTGGAATFVYVQSRGNRGYPFAMYEWSRRVAEALVGATVIENIGRIRDLLGPTVTDLAGLLSVSRQAIYDWQAGKSITAENSARLEELAKAADLLALEGLRGTSLALRRPIRNGKTFFDLVQEGGPAESAALGLIQIVRTENNQHEALRKRLAGRKRPSREAYGEIGAPMLDEEER